MEPLHVTQRKAWEYIKGLCLQHDEQRIVVNGQLAAALTDLQEYKMLPKRKEYVHDAGQVFLIGHIEGIALWVDPVFYWHDLCVRIDGRDDMKYDVAAHLGLDNNETIC